MFVVSDTSPLHYFIAVQQADVLPRLFTNVHVPPAVIRELSHPGTPVQIRQWVEKRPTWLMQVPLMRFLDPRLAPTLDQGEAEAIHSPKSNRRIFFSWTNGRVAKLPGVGISPSRVRSVF